MAEHDKARFIDGARVAEMSLEELQEHAATMALSNQSVKSARRLYLRIVNKDEQIHIGEIHSAVIAKLRQAQREGQLDPESDFDTQAHDLMFGIAPLATPEYELVDEAQDADIVLVHADDEITARELARYGLTISDVEEANNESK